MLSYVLFSRWSRRTRCTACTEKLVRHLFTWSLGLLSIAGVAALASRVFQSSVVSLPRSRTAPRVEIHPGELSAVWEELRTVGHLRGDDRASRYVIEFSDYECRFCRRSDSAINEWLRENPATVVLYVHFPLRIHPKATDAAAAAICAEAQGRFEELHRYLMTTEEWRSSSAWTRIATEVGMRDTQSFQDCLNSRETHSRITRGIEIARALGVRATPTFVNSDGRVHVGSITTRQLVALQ